VFGVFIVIWSTISGHPIDLTTAWSVDMPGENGIKAEQEPMEEHEETKIISWPEMKMEVLDHDPTVEFG
jgi:hypothetical protein